MNICHIIESSGTGTLQMTINIANSQAKKKLRIKWLSKRLIKEKIFKKNRLKNWSIKKSNIEDIIDIISQ